MADLADDLESMPAIDGAVEATPAARDKPVAASSIPAELVGQADNWGSPPEHIRTAISTVAAV